jgi:hypothetical protein
VHHDAGSLEAIMDEVGGLMEVFADVARFVVVGRYVEEVRNIIFRVTELHSFGCREDSLDLQS